MKKLIFSHALVFKLTSDGRVLTPGGIDNNYLKRYFDAGFEEIYILSRSSHCIDEKKTGYHELNNVNSYFLKKYSGGYKFLFSFKFYRDLYNLLNDGCLLVINYASITGLFLILFSYLFKLPYVVEVATDSRAYRGKKLGFFVQILSDLLGKLCIRKAVGSLYVAQFLKDKWKCDNGLVLSNVHIEDLGKVKNFDLAKNKFVVTTVGAISYRKGIDIIVDELKFLDESIKIDLHIIGPTIDQKIKDIINNTKLPNVDIYCHGILSRENINELLDFSDLYIQASRSEGLPRSVIEAMSRGVPVISSDLPGLKGIVNNDFQFKLGKNFSLVSLVNDVLLSSEKLNKMSKLSIDKAKEFHIDVTSKQRKDFYSKCKRLT